MNARTREDEAAWSAWVEGVRLNEKHLVLMRRVIAAVDAHRVAEEQRIRVRDHDERG
jgi:hypothetical protein